LYFIVGFTNKTGQKLRMSPRKTLKTILIL